MRSALAFVETNLSAWIWPQFLAGYWKLLTGWLGCPLPRPTATPQGQGQLLDPQSHTTPTKPRPNTCGCATVGLMPPLRLSTHLSVAQLQHEVRVHSSVVLNRKAPTHPSMLPSHHPPTATGCSTPHLAHAEAKQCSHRRDAIRPNRTAWPRRTLHCIVHANRSPSRTRS